MVGIVSDSTCDLVPELWYGFGVHIVPLYVQMGDHTYRDGVDLDNDKLYREIGAGRIPKTSAPSPGDFVRVYSRLGQRFRQIVSIHLAEGYSGTVGVARLASSYVRDRVNVTVVDSHSVSVGLGSVVLAAARVAQGGAPVDQVMQATDSAIGRCRLYGKLDDFGYLFRGRRFRLTRWLEFMGRLGSQVRVKMVGEAYDGGRIRSPAIVVGQAMALHRLKSIARRMGRVEDALIGYSTASEEAQMLALGLRDVLSEDRISITRIGCVTSTYVGPGTLVMAVRGREG